MYQNISITNIDTDILIEEESFHSCRIEGADTTIDELFDIFRAKRTETKGEKMILNTYRAVKYLNITRKRDVNTLVKLWKIVTKDVLHRLILKLLSFIFILYICIHFVMETEELPDFLQLIF